MNRTNLTDGFFDRDLQDFPFFRFFKKQFFFQKEGERMRKRERGKGKYFFEKNAQEFLPPTPTTV